MADRLRTITNVIGTSNNIRPDDKFQTVPSKGFFSDLEDITQKNLRNVVFDLNDHLKKKGKLTLDIEKLKNQCDIQLADILNKSDIESITVRREPVAQ